MLEHSLVFSSPIKRLRLLNWIAPVMSALLLVTFGTLSAPVASASATSSPTVLSGSVPSQVTGARLIGHHSAKASMTIGVLMQATNQVEMYRLVKAVTDRHSPLYRHWLKKGEFDQRFGPTSSQLATVRSWLQGAGLHVLPSHAGDLIVLASGTSGQMEAAFHTRINDYRAATGKVFFANSSLLQIPSALGRVIQGVLGLSNVAPLKPVNLQPLTKKHPSYGGGPNGTGLTPSQIAGIYNADPLYAAGNTGQGIILGLFELSGYTQSDIRVYEKQFGLPNVPVVNLPNPTLGGPTDSTGAGEVELDIELQIALAPGASGILVYNAPNIALGVILQYLQIAFDDAAASISTSWGICELGTFPALLDGELIASIKMLLQGQSIFAASGDSGAFDCGPLPGGNALQVDDPASQPYFVGAGGTSLGAFDPGSNPNPSYPTGSEVIWNNGCTPQACSGAGGGGVSHNWPDPGYQDKDPGVVEPGLSQYGAWCNQPPGTLCREVPDVSLNADPRTGYSIYCTDPVGCAGRGWLQIGGTSAAAPLWAAIGALVDTQFGTRVGPFFFLYALDPSGYGAQLHDITKGDNGFYPAGPTYDMASGLGTPDIALLVQHP